MDSIPIVIGIGLVLAFIASKIFKNIGIPQVVGFMVAGILLRAFGIFSTDAATTLNVIITLALGLIGYNIGLELKASIFKGRIKKLMIIVILEASVAFWLVSMLIFFITQQLYVALLLGAVASATAPAATADVVWDHKCAGPVSESVMFVLALDDVIAVILTNAAIAYALFVLAPVTSNVLIVIATPLLIIAGSVKMMVGGKTKILKVGEGVVIPSNVEHEATPLEPDTRMIDAFYPIREDYLQ